MDGCELSGVEESIDAAWSAMMRHTELPRPLSRRAASLCSCWAPSRALISTVAEAPDVHPRLLFEELLEFAEHLKQRGDMSCWGRLSFCLRLSAPPLLRLACGDDLLDEFERAEDELVEWNERVRCEKGGG